MISSQLSIISYNIRHCKGLDGKINLKRISDIISSAKPDLVSVQEVDCRCRRSQKLDEPKLLSEYLGYGYIFGKAINFGGGEYGNLMLYNPKTVNFKGNFQLPLPGNEPRECIVSTFDISGISVDFIVSHFGLKVSDRLESIKILDEKVVNTTNSDFIFLAGDLNANCKSQTTKELEKRGWVDTNMKQKVLNTFSTKYPSKQIDFVFFKKKPEMNLHVNNIDVLNKTKESQIASDHFPLLVQLELKKK